MSKLMTSLGGNTGAVLAGGGMAVALIVGAYLGFAGPEAASVPVTSATSETAETRNEEKPEVPETATPDAPSFDTLRREPDGTTIIAGRAEPLSEVSILVDGEQVGTATADSSGGFAAIATLPAEEKAQVVTLSAQSGEDVIASLDEVILAPSRLPEKPKTVVQSETPAETPIEKPDAPQPATAQAEPAQPTAPQNGNVAMAEPTAPAPAAPSDTPQASARIAVLKSDAEGVSLLSPTVTTEVALDTIGYSELGEVQLAGRAQPDTARVRVYLDNRSVISLPVGSDGRWRGDLPDVDEGVYTLRVDEVDADGAVSSRVETPFKRESAQTLAQASAQNDGPIKSITVQTGATLWAIARERYGDGTLYVRVVAANEGAIRDPDLIYPGQVFDLPN